MGTFDVIRGNQIVLVVAPSEVELIRIRDKRSLQTVSEVEIGEMSLDLIDVPLTVWGHENVERI